MTDTVPDPAFRTAVARLLETEPAALEFTAVSGGVSSDIWRVDVGEVIYCAKRALPRLKVADRWEAPVSRNAEEVRWLRTVRSWVGDVAAEVVAADADAGIAVLAWYDPAQWRNWKAELLSGVVRPACAERLGATLGTIARRAAEEPGLAAAFANDALFDALRIDPFFRHVVGIHPEVQSLIGRLTAGGTTLVHGDFSPKNVLVDEAGAVCILDAECACWGHPAFDPGYLVAHLLLKHLHLGDDALLGVAAAFWAAYRECVGSRFAGLDDATPAVVAGMLLARVDGKSPVEYLTPTGAESARARGVALLRDPPSSVEALLGDWSPGTPR